MKAHLAIETLAKVSYSSYKRGKHPLRQKGARKETLVGRIKAKDRVVNNGEV